MKDITRILVHSGRSQQNSVLVGGGRVSIKQGSCGQSWGVSKTGFLWTVAGSQQNRFFVDSGRVSAKS